MNEREQILRRAYDAFNARDVESALALMTADVDWPNVMDDRREHGHGAVRAYWHRQFAVVSPHVEPERFSVDEENRVVVDVHQVVRDTAGGLLADRRGSTSTPSAATRSPVWTSGRPGPRFHGCDSRGPHLGERTEVGPGLLKRRQVAPKA